MHCSSPPPEASNPPNMPEEAFFMENNDVYLHGRVDPGVDSNITLLETIDAPEPSNHAQRFKDPVSQNFDYTSSLPHPQDALPPTRSDKCLLLSALPSELVDSIMQRLAPYDLVAVSQTCRALLQYARTDMCWQRHVQNNVPGVKLESPSPCKSYRELYITHHPRWFLPKYKIWFSDFFLLGKVIICRYNPRSGSIEGYRLLAEKDTTTFDPWETDDRVLIHSFTPRPRLHKDKPILEFDAIEQESSARARGKAKGFLSEIPMRIAEERQPQMFSNFMFARTRPEEDIRNGQCWPPTTIPARHRVQVAHDDGLTPVGPERRSEMTDQVFRLRRWMEMNNNHRRGGLGVHMGEDTQTYSTLDPSLYTPTEEKPFRGIWVGDYSGHGCEFLLMNQPDNEEPFDETLVIKGEDETLGEWEVRKKEERIYRGRLEAIKLTGDPNIPRGEYTFVADDIGKDGFIRKADEARFQGARVVKSRGHIAARMFRDPKYIESQLIMVSHNRLAQFWVGFGHISFYERVDIDQFLSPLNDP